MEGLFEEISSEVRADRVGDLWKNYGRWVIYVAVSIVIVTAAAVYWNHHRRSDAMVQTGLYFEAAALMEAGNAKDALSALNKISVPEKSSYYGLVLLSKAQAATLLAQHAEAKITLTELAKRHDVYGDIGKVMLGDAVAAASKETTPLQFTRAEWVAWDLVAAGDKAKAAEKFSELAKNEAVPMTLRERATMMANYFTYNK